MDNQQDNVERSRFDQYNKMRQTNPDKFWKTSTQRKMYEDQQEQGPLFYALKGDTNYDT